MRSHCVPLPEPGPPGDGGGEGGGGGKRGVRASRSGTAALRGSPFSAGRLRRGPHCRWGRPPKQGGIQKNCRRIAKSDAAPHFYRPPRKNRSWAGAGPGNLPNPGRPAPAFKTGQGAGNGRSSTDPLVSGTGEKVGCRRHQPPPRDQNTLPPPSLFPLPRTEDEDGGGRLAQLEDGGVHIRGLVGGGGLGPLLNLAMMWRWMKGQAVRCI